MSHAKKIVLCLGLVLTAGLATAGGCGSSSSQADARDRATSTSCAWFQMCGKIGPGLMYETLDMCQVQVRAKWDTAWPVASCDGKIDESQLELCLQAISSTICDNGLDELNTLVNKCPEVKICAGASPDGG
jgi:hypothetical protein